MAHLLNLHDFHKPRHDVGDDDGGLSALPPSRPSNFSRTAPGRSKSHQDASFRNSRVHRMEKLTMHRVVEEDSSVDRSEVGSRTLSSTTASSSASQSSSASSRSAGSMLAPPRSKSSGSVLQGMARTTRMNGGNTIGGMQPVQETSRPSRSRPRTTQSTGGRSPATGTQNRTDVSSDDQPPSRPNFSRRPPSKSKSESLTSTAVPSFYGRPTNGNTKAVRQTTPRRRNEDESSLQSGRLPRLGRSPPRSRTSPQPKSASVDSPSKSSDLTALFQQAIKMEQDGDTLETVIQSTLPTTPAGHRRIPVGRTKSDSIAVMAAASSSTLFTPRSSSQASSGKPRPRHATTKINQPSSLEHDGYSSKPRNRNQNVAAAKPAMHSTKTTDKAAIKAAVPTKKPVQRLCRAAANRSIDAAPRSNGACKRVSSGNDYDDDSGSGSDSVSIDSDSDDNDEFDDDVLNLPARPKVQRTLSFSSVFSDPMLDDDCYTPSKTIGTISTRKESVTSRSLRSQTSSKQPSHTVSSLQTTCLLWIFCQLESTDEVITLYDVPSTCTFQEVMGLLWEKFVTSSSLAQQRPSLKKQRQCTSDVSLVLDSAEAAWCNATLKVPLPPSTYNNKTIEDILYMHYFGKDSDGNDGQRRDRKVNQPPLPDIVTLHMDL